MNIFDNYGQLEAHLGIPKKLLQRAKKLGCPGFRNTKMYADQIAPWLEQNKKLIETTQTEPTEKLKRKELENKIILQELKIEEERRNTINVKVLDEFITGFGIQLGATLKSKIVKELPPRVVGLNEEKATELCKEYYNNIIIDISRDLKEWAKQDGIKSEE